MTEETEKGTQDKKGISRRQFIVGTVGGIAVGAVAGFAGGYLSAPSTPTNQVIELPSSWDQTADVVVVGGGIAGLSAAIEAAKAGASVTLLEKAEGVGGATLLSGGLIYAANTSVQAQNGITDTVQAMIDHYTHAARGLADPNQIAIAAQKSADNINFMIGLGAVFGKPTVSGAEVLEGQPPTPRVHGTTANGGKLSGGAAVISLLKAGAASAGVNILTSTPAQKLIARGGKEVLGVQALSNGNTINIRANKGVILAAGGFQGSKTMQIKFSEKAYYSLPLGPPGLTGDGIVMGLALGADKINIEEVLGVPGIMLPGATSATFIEVPEFAPLPAILVNSRGMRYVDETIYYAHQNQELLRQETYTLEGAPKAFLVFDQALLDTLGGTLPVFSGSLSKNLTNEINEGLAYQAQTISALAAAISVDPTRLQNTISTWNTYSQNKADLDFGRTLGLGAISTPPYYAIPVQSTIFDTSGGLKINGNAQVIDTDGNVIPRLYAAGTNTGGVIGEYYPGSGTSLNQGLTFGRIAGQYVAAQSAWS